MRVLDIMSKPVVTVTQETPAKQAAGLLAAHGFTALPVVDDDERLVGIVTEADLMADRIPRDARFSRLDACERHPGATVAEVMTTPATAMGPGTELAVLARALLEARIRAMPIVDGARVVGIVTRGDIVRTFARGDADIAADVRHHLAIYGGADRWHVQVRDGIVDIADEFDDGTDRHVATLLAQSVPGVVRAHAMAAHQSGNS
ncbi:MAG TPA: CBS domain-containing protein [Amycolatopsis sp.]|uniref:CBS domain-containing protein n=1 Tax=Amycolatopsis sp. TaxID=37632 RepID=UPI002B487998|nr:CBS domain-containing protein [Amycolatopsis sp.]HKS44968.1 CBS domain-containing protein [Amycolatopsis sp.]